MAVKLMRVIKLLRKKKALERSKSASLYPKPPESRLPLLNLYRAGKSERPKRPERPEKEREGTSAAGQKQIEMAKEIFPERQERPKKLQLGVQKPHFKPRERDDSEDYGVLELVRKEEVREVPRIEIPKDEGLIPKKVDEISEKKESLKEIRMSYVLYPQEYQFEEDVMAIAKIRYDEESEQLLYEVIEPDLNERLKKALQKIEEILKDVLEVSFEELRKEEAIEFLKKKILEIMKKYKISVSKTEEKIIKYYAYRDFIGFGKIEPLLQDPNIEDISCDGAEIPVYVYHRAPNIGSIKTNVVFNDKNELNSFVIKLAQRCGRSISVAQPLLDGTLPDGSRVQATLGTDIARRGSNFTIRKFSKEPITPIHLMDYGTLNSEMLAYFWLAVEHGKSILIAGATASGKTTLLNALSLFIKPESKIISIEDTAELRLPHSNWVPEVARSGFGFTSGGEVTLDDLLKESLRQRPDYIIVGEVRGKEAYILFQQMATGHPGMSTIHASSIEKVIDRLITKPIELPPSLIENLDIIVFMKRIKYKNLYVRRIEKVIEIEGFGRWEEMPFINTIFEWNPINDSFEMVSKSSVLHRIAYETGLNKEAITTEFLNRKKVLEWMHSRKIRNYIKVGKILERYYHEPQALLKVINEER